MIRVENSNNLFNNMPNIQVEGFLQYPIKNDQTNYFSSIIENTPYGLIFFSYEDSFECILTLNGQIYSSNYVISDIRDHYLGDNLPTKRFYNVGYEDELRNELENIISLTKFSGMYGNRKSIESEQDLYLKMNIFNCARNRENILLHLIYTNMLNNGLID
jgi:hypothetical protein